MPPMNQAKNKPNIPRIRVGVRDFEYLPCFMLLYVIQDQIVKPIVSMKYVIIGIKA